MDEDGKVRAVIKACDTHQCPNVVGVIIPANQSAHHGNPDFDYLDRIKETTAGNWEAYWKQKHIGIELTGFRMTMVIVPVKTGDILVSSGVAGYAIATKKPGMSAIIGKAAQDFEGKEGEKSMIWARIHLQSGSSLYPQVETLMAENEKLNDRAQSLEAKIERLEHLVLRVAQDHQDNMIADK